MAKGSKTEPFFFFSFKGYDPELFKSHYQGVKKEKNKTKMHWQRPRDEDFKCSRDWKNLYDFL